MTELEIVELALDRIMDPEREFRESVILLLASKLASKLRTNNTSTEEK